MKENVNGCFFLNTVYFVNDIELCSCNRANQSWQGLLLKIKMLKIILFIRCHCCVNFL